MLKKITLISSVVLLASASIVSCKKDEDSSSTCKTCTQKVEQYLDGELMGTTNVGAQEYCGDQLNAILANPTTTIEQTVGGFTQTVTTTFNCQ